MKTRFYVSQSQLDDKTLEYALIYHLIKHRERRKFIVKTFPAMFSDPLARSIFSVIKELDMEGKEVSAFSVSNILHSRDGKDRNSIIHLFDETYVAISEEIPPQGAIEELKKLLYKRIALDRVNDVIQIIESPNGSRSISTEFNKILTAESSLLSKRTDSLEDIARATARRINTVDDTIVTGFPFLNRRTAGLTTRSVSGLLGRPSHGKSLITCALCRDTVMRSNIRALIISLEDPVEEIIKKIIADPLNLSLIDMRFKKINVPEEDVVRFLKVSLGGRLYVVDTRHVLTADDAATAIGDIKPNLVVVDYIQNFKMDDMVVGIIKAIRILNIAAMRHNCHIMICSQVPDKEIAKRTDPMPTASDSQWNSALYQSASEMFSLYYKYIDTKNPIQKNSMMMSILKAKFSGGLSASIKLNINPDYCRMTGEVGAEHG